MPGASWRAYAPYSRFLVLITLSYVKDDIENFMVYCLLALKAGEGCDFSSAYGSYLYYNAATQFVVVPVLSWVTDRTTKYAQTVLMIALCIEFSMEVSLFSMSSLTLELVMALQLVRSAAHSQNYNSVWKLFKRKVGNYNSGVLDLEEDKIYATIGILGICGEVLIDVCVFSTAYVLITRGGYSLHEIARFVYAATFCMSSLAICAGMSITKSYLRETGREKSPLLSPAMRAGLAPTMKGQTTLGALPAEHDDDDVDVGETAELTDPHRDSQDELKKQEATLDHIIRTQPLRYFKEGLSHIFHDRVSFGTLFHAFQLYLVWQLMWNAEPLALANHDIHKPKTIENLCGGEFEHLFLQAVITNAIYFVFGLFFVFGLLRLPPLTYFATAYPIMGTVFTLCVVPFFFGVGYYVKAVLASLLAVVPWFLWRYDTFITTANVSQFYLGILTGIIGYIRYITPVLPGLLLRYHQDNLILILAVVLFSISVMYSLYFAKTGRAELADLQAHFSSSKPTPAQHGVDADIRVLADSDGL